MPSTVKLLAGLLLVVPAMLADPHFCCVCFFSTLTHNGYHSMLRTSFPKGRCSLADCCLDPTHELQKHCPGCNWLNHVLCSQVLEEDEGSFKADSVVCCRCNPQKEQQPQQPQQHLNPPDPVSAYCHAIWYMIYCVLKYC